MFKTMMYAKLHNGRVTEANLNYVGSITIDEDLLDATGISVSEKVQIVNNNNGARFETYVIAGNRGSGIICLNGAAARLAQVGDVVIIMAYMLVDINQIGTFSPNIAVLDESNRIVKHSDKELQRMQTI
ncbi:aspartate 1-decarboxylase [Paenibacillus sp. RRE4]|uniref:aspartate 1-decarboxylase n=1 Tax=Paenibacillus sp. RRE4 TaxID=2962587 RepID=UPI0028824029|nr:aspartate 1-decarboxylase [Paenibacillus sp. RRE4]MDT0125307.1 aspartate 1-decarboxylase [Paenibacillus sp. RRE4]